MCCPKGSNALAYVIVITRGALTERAEIIPIEPDAGNAAEGKAKAVDNVLLISSSLFNLSQRIL